MKWTFFLLLVCGLCSGMTRINLNETADDNGAVCLDGSTGIYYFKAGSKTNSTKWIIHFMAGGICMTDEECLWRTTTYMGSSNDYPYEVNFGYYATLSEDVSLNPDFHDWNHVLFPYVDGACFSGDVEEPVTVGTGKVYYRGHRIVVTAFKDLLKTKGLDKATDVLLVGDSAGAMATYYHADEIKSMLPDTVRFKAAPLSGIFLDRPNAEGKVFFRDLFKHVYEMQNCSHTLNAKCLEAYPGDEGYKCFFAQYSLEFTETPIFAVNSAYDVVGMRCIVMGEPLIGPSTSGVGNCSAIPGWEECSNFTCTDKQWSKLEEYAMDFRSIIENNIKLNSPGNGLFEHSCITHAVEPYDPYWRRYTVEGTVLRDAIRDWFFSDNETASKHFYKDCHHTQTTACNPTCEDPSSLSSYSSENPSFFSSSSSRTSDSSKATAATVYPLMSIVVAVLLSAFLLF